MVQIHKASIKLVTPTRGSMPDPTFGLKEFGAEALFTGAARLDEASKEMSFELRWSAKGGDETAADVYKALSQDFELSLFKLHTTTR